MRASTTRASCRWGGSKVLVRLDGEVKEVDLDETNDLPADIEILIYTVLTRYRYLIG